MALQLRRGTDAERLLVVFAEGEPVWTTDTNMFYLGDGVTLGGVLVTGQNFDQYLNTSSNVIFADVTATNISVSRLQFVSSNGNLELGYLALQNTGTAISNNIAVGDTALNTLTNGYSNIGIGYAAGLHMDSGNRNIFLGYGAGSSLTGGSNNNTIIGNEELFSTSTLNDTLIIGTGNTERLKVDDSGLYINGSIFSGGSTFDQDLNTTDNVEFAGLVVDGITFASSGTSLQAYFYTPGSEASSSTVAVSTALDIDISFISSGPITDLLTSSTLNTEGSNWALTLDESALGNYSWYNISGSGNTDYIKAYSSDGYDFSSMSSNSNWTIDMWIRPESSGSGGGNQMLVNGSGFGDGPSNIYFSVDNSVPDNGTLRLGNGNNEKVGPNVTSGAWHHVGVMRSGGVMYWLLDGTATAVDGNPTINFGQGLQFLGGSGKNSFSLGYASDIRVSKDTALFSTGSYTLPIDTDYDPEGNLTIYSGGSAETYVNALDYEQLKNKPSIPTAPNQGLDTDDNVQFNQVTLSGFVPLVLDHAEFDFGGSQYKSTDGYGLQFTTNGTNQLWMESGGSWEYDNDLPTVVVQTQLGFPDGTIQTTAYTGGATGYTGSQGDVGFVGSTGDVGYTGSAGNDGAIGYTGSAGNDGAIGYVGSQGDTGYIGSAGADGSDGSDGSTGYTGSAGTSGSAGATGYTGSAGADGTIGSDGATGYTGSIGFTGSIGYTGSAAGLSVGSYVVRGQLSGNQTVTSGSDAVVQFVDDFDPQNWLSSNKFQPTIAGYYSLDVSINWQAGVISTNQTNVQLRKNGSTQIAIWQLPIQTASSYNIGGSEIVYFNGSTDYVEVTAYTSNTTNQVINANAGTYFAAALYAYGQTGATGYTGSAGSAGSTGYTGSAGTVATKSVLYYGTTGSISGGALPSTNNSVAFNLNYYTTGTNISITTSTGAITLQPGYTYKLTGDMGRTDYSSSAGYLNSQWYNVTTSAVFGPMTGDGPPASTAFYGCGPVVAYLTVSGSAVTVKFSSQGSSNLTVIGQYGSVPTVLVEQQ